MLQFSHLSSGDENSFFAMVIGSDDVIGIKSI
jgi:hypothetical protein